MDDPWGSPWNIATAERAPSPTKSIQSARSDLEPPPRAFLSASNSPRLPPASSHSAWEDNDGLGDWAGGTTSPASGWSGWAGEATPQKHQATPKATDEGFGFGSASPIAWPGNVVGARHVSGTPFREPSFDPWASEVDEPRVGQDAPRFVIDGPRSPTDITKWQEVGQNQDLKLSVAPAEDNNDNGYLPVRSISPDAEEASADVLAHQDSKEAEEQPGRLDPEDRFQEAHDPLPRSSHSPSSSVSQQDSDRDTNRQDSPITSIDEDARSRMPLPSRKVSGKLQVLVEKFDGLVKAAEEGPINAKRSRSATPLPLDVPESVGFPDDAAEFGDFGDAQYTKEERPATPTANQSGFAEATSQQPLTSHTQPVDLCVETWPPTQARERAGAVGIVSSEVRHVSNKFSDVKFDVNVALVDDLFKDIQLDSTEANANPGGGIPDYPIRDSFTETSERKVWYRISRQGSSRKHNFGDWNSYRRVTWETSALHADVLKIVRQWMEQDSITGRTTLGGGTNKTDIFGWDSGAEPVALEKVFARKHRPAERPMSLQQPLQMPPLSPVTSTPASRQSSAGQRPSSLASPSTVAFGWSSAPVTAKEGEPREPTQTQISTSPKIQGRSQPTVKSVVTSTPIVLSAPQQTEDDDDWGEMVSSPVEAPKTTPLDSVLLSPTQADPPSTLRSVTTGSDINTQRQNFTPQTSQSTAPTAPVQSRPFINKPEAFSDLSLLEGPTKPTVDTSVPPLQPTCTPLSPTRIQSPTTSSIPVLGGTIKSVQHDKDDPAEAESLMRQVIGNLPDLSYMLK